jgi:protein arginine N-methyltransferase 2
MVQEGILLDAIYYDTFAEDYQALKEFFSEWVIQLLDSDGLFGWYNGLGADRQICYDVYTKVSWASSNLRYMV